MSMTATSKTNLALLAILGVLLSVRAAPAAVISASATPPTVDPLDIAQLTGSTDIGGDQGHIWTDRPVHGQTFTTLGYREGYWLQAITLKDLNDLGSAGAFTVRVGTISGNSLTLVASETTPSGAAYKPGDYVTAAFSTPVWLSPNTVYSFDWTTSGAGFVTANNSDGNAYARGTAYSSGASHEPDDANLVFHTADRVFHLDLTRTMPRPALEYFFNDASGSVVPNHGTLGAAGNATLNASTTVGTIGQPFVRGGYLVVDQAGDRLATADLDSLDQTGDFTLSFFVKPTTTLGDWKDMVGDCDSSPSNLIPGWQLQSFADGRLSLRLWEDKSSDTATSTSIASFNSPANLLVANEWHQIGITVSGAKTSGTHSVTVEFYRDGTLFSSSTLSGLTKIMGNSSDGFKLGNAMWDSELLAQYGGVAYFDTVLTPAEMAAYYNYFLTPEPSALALAVLGVLAGWKFTRRRPCR
jgi:hypothetical protein